MCIEIVGQDKLLNKINSYTIDTLPRTILIIGDEGSGKHLISKHIATKFNLIFEDITESISYDKIMDMQLKTDPYLYVIDTDNDHFQIKNQNMILKFIEEPLKNTYIILLSRTGNNLLPTIINRCQTLNIQIYTRDILSKFISDTDKRDLILSICSTPGQIEKYKDIDINSILDLANKIVEKIKIATLPNTLSISNKLSFKGELDKIDVKLFGKVLCKCITDHIVAKENKYDYYLLINDFYNKLYTKNIDKKHLFENFITKLWEVGHNEVTNN